MAKKKEILILIVGAALLVSAYLYLDTSNTLFGTIKDKFTSVNWDEVHPRNIVKNSIPIVYLETNGSSCLVKAETFEMIIKHPYFVRGNEVSEKLQYDPQEKTLVIPCKQLPEDKSRLHVWYVVEESLQHSTKWQYSITPWNQTSPSFIATNSTT